jgi:hypothetical protein
MVLENYDDWFYEAGRRGRIKSNAPCPLRFTFDLLTLQVGRCAGALRLLPQMSGG